MDLDYVVQEEVVETSGYVFEEPAPPRTKSNAFEREGPITKKELNGNIFGVDFSKIEHLDSLFSKEPELEGVASKAFKATKASGTVSGYHTVITDFKNFCDMNGYESSKTAEQSLAHFLLYLEERNVSYHYMHKLRAALKLFEQVSGQKVTAFSDINNRLYEGVQNLATHRRPPVKKANRLPLEHLRFLVSKVVTPYKNDIMKIDLIEFRTVFRLVIEYFTFARQNDFAQLQAKHFKSGESEIEIFFPFAKNDPHHEGNVTKIVANATEFCPVQLTRWYFQRCNFQFSHEGVDDSFVHCRVRKSNGTTVADGRFKLGATTAKEQLVQLLKKFNLPYVGVTDKSAKMEGVTNMLENGATLEETQHQGRWKSADIAKTYKFNSGAYKSTIAEKVPF